MIGGSWEFTWTDKKGGATQIEVGEHPEADFNAFYFGKTRRVGTRYDDDSITFWNPSGNISGIGRLPLTVFVTDLVTFNMRKLDP